jgi:hypothetical protein
MSTFSGLWLRVDFNVDTNVSEDYTASIFSSEDDKSVFLWKAVIIYKSTRRHNPENVDN